MSRRSATITFALRSWAALGLPSTVQRPQQHHDYQRNGTATLFAAMNTLDGSVISFSSLSFQIATTSATVVPLEPVPVLSRAMVCLKICNLPDRWRIGNCPGDCTVLTSHIRAPVSRFKHIRWASLVAKNMRSPSSPTPRFGRPELRRLFASIHFGFLLYAIPSASGLESICDHSSLFRILGYHA